MTKIELIDLLNATKKATLECFHFNDEILAKTHGKGSWNIRQILHHLTDTELVFTNRIKKIMAEPSQVIWVAQQEDWDKAFQYVNAPLVGNLELYLASRNANINLVSLYFDSHGNQQFVHSEMGRRTLKEEMIKVAVHNQKHLQQIKKALNHEH